MPHAQQTNSWRGALVVTGVALVIGVGLIGSIHWIYLDLHPVAPRWRRVVGARGRDVLEQGISLTDQIQPIRGMNDVLPAESVLWQHLEATVRELLVAYGYEEIRVPVVEHTELFKRAIGEFTDVVEKEMYTFTDQGGESLTLRPEATAGIVRAMISNGLLRGARHKLWCIGPMFRHEKPQKGRYRQFHQVDVEAVGFAGPDVDAELIALTARLWRRLGITRVKLQINSLGTAESRRHLSREARRVLLGAPRAPG